MLPGDEGKFPDIKRRWDINYHVFGACGCRRPISKGVHATQDVLATAGK